jgi:hypothetical protein
MVNAPVSFYLKSFEGQLQNLKDNISPELSNNGELVKAMLLLASLEPDWLI